MTADEYLRQINIIRLQLQSMKRQAQLLHDGVTNISPILRDTPRSSSSDPHRMEGLIAAKVDLENEVVVKTELLTEITRTINSLSDPLHVSIITSRYFCRMDWMEIANELHMSKSRIYHHHREALAALEKSIADSSKQ